MKTKVFEMPALFADHHVTEVRRLLLELTGVKDIYASSAFHIVEVTYDEKSINDLEIALKLDEAGYLGEWTVPAEAGSGSHSDENQTKYFRHTAVYETVKKTVTFAQRVGYQGRPLWHCPGIGTIKQDEETDHA